jgi:uncharacterized protein (TIGR02453 family)
MVTYFTPALFAFLRDLDAHNEREWFHSNKQRYIDVIQEPALAFISDFAPRLSSISPHFSADARVNGGSLFRIHRDTRFSADKTPYKTNTGVHFRHEAAKDVHAPGYYLHLEPTACFAGVGLWRPETAVLNRIRRVIQDDPKAWERAAKGKAFTDSWTPGTEDMLKRVPSGFDPEGPHADDLRLKSHTAGRRLTQKEVTSATFIDEYAELCSAASPYMGFLCQTVGVDF